MKRLALLLSLLAAILTVVLWWFLFMSPQREELEVVEAEIEQTLAQQQQVRSRVAQLQQVRERVPEIEADLAAAGTLIPNDAALPALIRQLQLASDESQTEIPTISVSRPTGVEGSEAGQAELSSIQLTLSVEGSYFQIVDLLRRMEDPTIVGRGMLIDTLSLGIGEYPDLQASVSARVYAVIPPTVTPDAEVADPAVEGEDGDPAEDGAEDGDDDGGDDDAADVEGTEDEG